MLQKGQNIYVLKCIYHAFFEKTYEKIWNKRKNLLPLHSQIRNGTLADRLGNGLQNRVEQFDSARYLKVKRAVFH